jgi:dinuclear metal center YbgI/SA1388 family protein
MVSVNDVCQVLQQLAPLATAESWDNVGLLLGRPERSVTRLMTCLTLTPAVAREAIAEKVEMIVTHHPVLFRATKTITSDTIEGGLLLDLIEAGIAVYSPHTAFDSADLGINQWLAESLGLNAIEPLRPFQQSILGGSGRTGVFSASLSKADFLEKVATIVGADYLEISWHGSDLVSRVGLACGSAAEYLTEAVEAKCDTFVTGEARFHSAVECQSRAMNLVLTGHFCSERPAVEKLAGVLSERLGNVECFSSREDRDPLEMFHNVSGRNGSAE